MARYALLLEYDGSAFHGWQTQPSGRAAQDALELALAQVAGEPVATVCAGRTDSGVHATTQVVHFDCTKDRPLSAWLRGVNTHLPKQISVWQAIAVAEGFHARFDATERYYRYVLLNRPARAGLLSQNVGWYHQALNIEAMRQAGVLLLGRHDFSSFRAAACQAHSPVRELLQLNITKHGEFIFFDFSANAFLHHMVRNIVGSLVYIGRGVFPPEGVVELLAAKSREKAPPTFAPNGLYLCGVRYPAASGLGQNGLLQRLPQIGISGLTSAPTTSSAN